MPHGSEERVRREERWPAARAGNAQSGDQRIVVFALDITLGICADKRVLTSPYGRHSRGRLGGHGIGSD